MSYQRIERISEEIKRELSGIIRDDVKDPRISRFFSVVKVETSRDLRHSKVYVSILGTKGEKENTIEGLKRASGFIRKELGNRLDIRYIPELHFILDSSIEYSIEISKKLDELRQDREDKNG